MSNKARHLEVPKQFISVLNSDDPSFIAKTLSEWASGGYSSAEIAACANYLRERCDRVEAEDLDVVDIVGTGASSFKTFNVSTAASFVVAGAGIPVAKHGNRAATSKSGSADVIEELGIEFSSNSEEAKAHLESDGICFMFAPYFHSLNPAIGEARRMITIPTIFNLIGPLANPAFAPFQVIGVWSEEFLPVVAEAVRMLGTKQTFVVHGEPGIDEVSPFGKTTVSSIRNGEITQFDLSPEHFGLRTQTSNLQSSSDRRSSSKIISDVLIGKRQGSWEETAILLNSALAIHAARGVDYQEATEIACESITSGRAQSRLDALRKRKSLEG